MGASIIEIQNGVIVTPITHYTAAEVQNQTALSGWYSVCASAAVSSVANHTVILLADDGYQIRKEVFHRVQEIVEETQEA